MKRWRNLFILRQKFNEGSNHFKASQKKRLPFRLAGRRFHARLIFWLARLPLLLA